MEVAIPKGATAQLALYYADGVLEDTFDDFTQVYDSPMTCNDKLDYADFVYEIGDCVFGSPFDCKKPQTPSNLADGKFDSRGGGVGGGGGEWHVYYIYIKYRHFVFCISLLPVYPHPYHPYTRNPSLLPPPTSHLPPHPTPPPPRLKTQLGRRQGRSRSGGTLPHRCAFHHVSRSLDVHRGIELRHQPSGWCEPPRSSSPSSHSLVVLRSLHERTPRRYLHQALLRR